MQACGGVTPAAGLSASDMQTLVNCNATLNPTTNPQFQLVNMFSPLDGHTIPVYDYASAAINSLGAVNYLSTDTNPSRTLVYNGFDIGFNARLPKGGRMFGGTTTQRTMSNTCDTGEITPANLLNCDTAHLQNGLTLPWLTQIKLAATYPLPFFGLIVNGAYQGLPGYTASPRTRTRLRLPASRPTSPARQLRRGRVRGGARIDASRSPPRSA